MGRIVQSSGRMLAHFCFWVLLPSASTLSTVAVPQKGRLPITNIVDQRVEEDNSIQEFHRWADEQGITRKVEVHQDTTAGGGRGLIASERIEAGEVAARVPLTAVMRLEHHPDYDMDDQWAGLLASRLWQESQLLSSPWAPYLSSLPSEAPLTPCRWNAQQLDNLQNETFVQVIQENSEWRQRQWMAHRDRNNNNNDIIDEVDYMKWLDLVCSRTLKGRDGSRQLVPLIDIANHAPSEAGGGHFMVDKEAVYLIAGSRGVNPGQAVTLDYGARTVDDFLLHYGFVPQRCVSDSVILDLDNDVEDKESSSSVTRTIQWRDCQGYSGHPQNTVREACSRLLETYPTTMEDDVARLNQGEFSSCEAEQWALAYRYAKKSLLASAVGLQQSERSKQSAFATSL